MMWSSAVIRGCAIVLAGAVAMPARGTVTTFQGLGYLPTPDNSNSSIATGVSADGSVIVGYSNSGANDKSEAFRWAGGPMTGLGYLGGGDTSMAHAVSADGSTVVGTSNGSVGNYVFEWSGSIGQVDHSICAGAGPQAYGVSSDGSVIVGQNGDDHAGGCYSGRAVQWAGGTQSLLFPGASPPSGLARGINPGGSVIVGEVAVSACPCVQAFRWTSGGSVTLGDFGASYHNSSAYATNADGTVVVGTASVTNTEYHPFRWTATTGLVSLVPSGLSGTAEAVSADGRVVVGTINNEAFRWQPTTGLEYVQDLLNAAGVDTTDWNLHEATGISADGTTIVGQGGNSIYTQAWVARIPPDEIFSDGFGG